MSFDVATPGRILFGSGRSAEVPALARAFGQRALVVLDSEARASRLLAGLAKEEIQVAPVQVDREPDLSLVEMAMRIGAQASAELVIGFGGGAALDTAKAAAALLTNPGDPRQYLEVVGSARPLQVPSLPFLAVPTTAGTGSEASRNAVLCVPEQHLKVSLRSPLLLPRLAIVDPELTLTLPSALTASTGLDALTHLLEAYLCNSPSPLVDALCRDGIPRAAQALPRVFAEPGDLPGREQMALASLYGGLALANARLGAVHGLAAVIGGGWPAPHGAVCARLLPGVLGQNLAALRERAPDHPVLARFEEIARLLSGQASARAADGPAHLAGLVEALGIPRLAAFGLTRDDLAGVARQAQRSSSMKGNPLPLTDAELVTVLAQAL